MANADEEEEVLVRDYWEKEKFGNLIKDFGGDECVEGERGLRRRV
jgi:hypothetical protein